MMVNLNNNPRHPPGDRVSHRLLSGSLRRLPASPAHCGHVGSRGQVPLFLRILAIFNPNHIVEVIADENIDDLPRAGVASLSSAPRPSGSQFRS